MYMVTFVGLLYFISGRPCFKQQLLVDICKCTRSGEFLTWSGTTSSPFGPRSFGRPVSSLKSVWDGCRRKDVEDRDLEHQPHATPVLHAQHWGPFSRSILFSRSRERSSLCFRMETSLCNRWQKVKPRKRSRSWGQLRSILGVACLGLDSKMYPTTQTSLHKASSQLPALEALAGVFAPWT